MSAERLPLGKECSKCGEWKLFGEYHWKISKEGTLASQCKTCKSEYGKKYREENRQEILAQKSVYREENRNQILQAARFYREKNRDKLSENQRYAYAKNSGRQKEYLRRWRKENPVKYLALRRRRRAMRMNVQGKHTAEEWINLREKYSNICLCCGEEKELTADHVIPLSKGGTNDISNIQPLCRSCNSRKHTKTTDYRPLFDQDTEELGETG